MHLEVSLIVVGAVLTVVGYSLNDTIIIFDRVRENLRKYRRQNLY
jgi:preprotein translocase subunit SecF